MIQRRRLAEQRRRKAEETERRTLTKLTVPTTDQDRRGITDDPFKDRERALRRKRVGRVRLMRGRNSIRQAIVMAEILGQPVAEREPGASALPPRDS